MWIAAAVEGDAQAVAAWLDEGGEVDAGCAERNDTTLLIAAAAGGQEAMVRRLLQRGASINLQDSLGITALMGAAANGHTAIVQALLDTKADASLQATHGDTALMLAEQEKHTATVQLLRQHAKRRDAVKKDDLSVVGTALYDAAFEGDAHAVAAWLHKGGGVDAGCAEHKGANTLLMAAAVGGQEAMVRMLLQRGVSVNLQDSLGFTALMCSARMGHTATVQVLLDAKADALLQSENGYRALMWAEHKSRPRQHSCCGGTRRAAGR